MQSMQNDGSYDVYWPRAARRQVRKSLAKRPESLTGKTVAFVWDNLFKGDQIFRILEEQLTARFPGIRFVKWTEFGNTHGSDERKVVAALPVKLKALGVDVVVSGMAC